MATKSIIKNINIHDRKLGKQFIIALENAAGKKGQNTELSRTYSDIKGAQIRNLFGKNS